MYTLRLLALVFFLLGFAILVRAFRAPRWEFARYMRAAVGAMAVGAGNLLLLRAPTVGLLFILVGVWLIISLARVR